MYLRMRDTNLGERLAVLLLVLMIPAFAAAQNKSKGSAPAPKAAAPAAHPQSAPRPAAPSSAQRGPSTAGRPSTGANTTRGAVGGANTRGTTNTRGTSTAGGENTRGTTNTRGTSTAGGANTRGTTNTRGTGTAGGANTRGTTNTRGTSTAGGANAKGGGANTRGTSTAGGAKTSAARGTTTRQVTTRSGAKVTASYRGGNVRSIQAHNMRIDHGVRGGRHVVTERNGRRVVGMGHGRGYSERAYYNHGGRSYYQRTYYMGGRRYAYAYRGYYYHGARYYGYAPAYYYHPVYYGWAYNPWPAPVYYNWGWGGNPWYGYYGYYYAPYPVYPAAAFWLTDYMIAANLQAAYDAGVAAGAAGGMASVKPDTDLFALLASPDPLIAANLEAAYGGMFYASSVQSSSQTQLSKEVKDGLADEVKAQIAADKATAENPKQASASSLATPAVILLPLMFAPAAEAEETPPALDPKFRYFVVASDVDLSPDGGQDCQLTQGDVLKRTGDQLDNNNSVEVVVKSSKKDDCAVGTKAMLDANELQEMYNHFRETLDAGLKSLAENSGKNGVPPAPDTGTTAGEVPAPTPDANVDSDLQQQQKDADQMEAEVKQSSGGQ